MSTTNCLYFNGARRLWAVEFRWDAEWVHVGDFGSRVQALHAIGEYAYAYHMHTERALLRGVQGSLGKGAAAVYQDALLT